jgi:hypothetical protein
MLAGEEIFGGLSGRGAVFGSESCAGNGEAAHDRGMLRLWRRVAEGRGRGLEGRGQRQENQQAWEAAVGRCQLLEAVEAHGC